MTNRVHTPANTTKSSTPANACAISTLRALAAEPGNLPDAAASPDARLLELCDEIIFAQKQAVAADERRRAKQEGPYPWRTGPTIGEIRTLEKHGMRDALARAMEAADREAAAEAQHGRVLEELSSERARWSHTARAGMRAAGKIKATSPAGLYAKACVVRASPAGAPGLTHSLAIDLIACDGLRSVLWPAAAGDT